MSDLQNSFAVSNNVKVYVVPEVTRGTIAYVSTVATTAKFQLFNPIDPVIPKQKPVTTESKEKSPTLNVMDVFNNSLPVAELSLNQYIRYKGDHTRPQGSVLFESMMGEKISGTTATLSAGVSSTSAATLILKSASARLPNRGVVQIGSEKIFYKGLVRSSLTATTATMTGCIRGFMSTTAATHATSAAMSIKTIMYSQKTSDTPSFTAWVQLDFMLFGVIGCSVKKGTFSLAKDDAVSVKSDCSGMKVYWAGVDQVKTLSATGATRVPVKNAKMFTEKMPLWNETKNDSNSGAGYIISDVDYTNNELVFTEALNVDWEVDDKISGFLPTVAKTGSVIENRATMIDIDGIEGFFKATDVSVDCPKKYIEDLVGQAYPSFFVEDKRKITTDYNIILRREDVALLKEGYDGREAPIVVKYGVDSESSDNVGIVELYAKRCKFDMPDISDSSPTVDFSMPVTMMGTEGEDSLEVLFHQ